MIIILQSSKWLIQLKLFLTQVLVIGEPIHIMSFKKYHYLILGTALLFILTGCSDDAQNTELSEQSEHKLYDNPKKAHSYKINGLAIENPYYWLLNSNSEEVQSWLAQQSEQTQQYFSTIKDSSSSIELGTVSNYHHTSAIKNHYFYINKKFLAFEHEWLLGFFNTITNKTTEYPLLLTDDQSISNLKVTQSGRHAAIQIKTKSRLNFFGQEQAKYQWRIFDTANRTWVNRKLPVTTQATSFIWLDNRQFIYSDITRTKIMLANPLKNKRFDLTLMTSEDNIENFSRITNQLLVTTRSTNKNSGKTNILLLTLKKTPAKAITLIDKISFKLKLVAASQDKLFFITDWAAPRNRIISVDIKKPQKKYWKEVIAQKKSVLHNAVRVGGSWVLHYNDNSNNRVDIAKNNSKKTRNIFKQSNSSIKLNPSSDNAVIIELSSLTQSTRPLSIHLKSNSISEIFSEKSQSLVNIINEKNASKLFFYKNKKGTKLPITLVEKNNVKENIKPTLLVTHGLNRKGFEYQYNPLLKTFIEKNGRLAIAHTRSDNSYSEAWEKSEQATNIYKMSSDLSNAQEWLIENEYSDRNRLAAYAESGTALVFASLLKGKNHFKAMALDQGIYDLMLPENMNLVRSKNNNTIEEKTLLTIQSINPRTDATYSRIPALLFTNQSRKNYPYIAELQNSQRANRPILLDNSPQMNTGNRLKKTWLFLQQELNL